jgi:hypothetical protein
MSSCLYAPRMALVRRAVVVEPCEAEMNTTFLWMVNFAEDEAPATACISHDCLSARLLAVIRVFGPKDSRPSVTVGSTD